MDEDVPSFGTFSGYLYAMIPEIPPPTEIPDYILYRRERQPYPPRSKKLQQPRPIVIHTYRTLEEALTAAKRSARRNRLYYGRSGDEFRVYEGGSVIERYVVEK